MKIYSEVKIGVVVLAALALLIWGLNFLKGENLLSTKKEYYAVYSKIDGLVEGNPVLVNGYKVGQVGKISFHPDMSGEVLVKFIVSIPSIKLPKDTEAKIFSSDLLGSKAVELVIGYDTSYCLQPGDTFTSSIEINLQESVNLQIAPLKKKTEELISSLDSAVIIIQQILNEKARENLGKGFESIKRSFEKFESAANSIDQIMSENQGRISDIFAKIQAIASNLNKNNEQLSNVIQNFSTISDSLAKANITTTLKSAEKALGDAAIIMEKIKSGEGTMGMLVNNDSLYLNLESASKKLDNLLIDIDRHPNRYMHFSIFGKKEK